MIGTLRFHNGINPLGVFAGCGLESYQLDGSVRFTDALLLTVYSIAKDNDMEKKASVADYAGTLDKLNEMFSEGYDWAAHWERDEFGAGPEDLFKSVYLWHDYRLGNREVPAVSCGGHSFEDTPKSLYRALFLLKPSEIDFSDMYKTGTLIDVVSPCKQFVISLQLWKYELAMYFRCAKEYAAGQRSGIVGGWADCDNGVKCSSELGNKWFDVAVKALEREWTVYGGNDFCV